MTGLDLARRLRTLHRTALMLETELRHGKMDGELIAEIDRQMEHGIGTDPRCEVLRGPVDALRESTMTPRAEVYGDTVRACERLRDAIGEVLGRLG